MTLRELRRTIYKRIFHSIDRMLLNIWLVRRPIDYERVAYIMAAVESARFFQSSMRMAPNLVTQEGLLDHAIGQVSVDGLWMEFGVWQGATIRRIAQKTSRSVFGFDSFEGLPEDWTHFQKAGRFSLGGQTPQNLPGNIRLVKGWFSDTLPPFLHEYEEPVAFLHVDCDLYSSTKTVLTCLRDRMTVGTIIVFDEYLNYPGWQEHEHKAFTEFVEDGQFTYEFLGFASSHFSVAIRITGVGNSGDRVPAAISAAVPSV